MIVASLIIYKVFVFNRNFCLQSVYLSLIRDEIKFGKSREIAWKISFSDRFFRKMPFMLSISYEVLMDFIPESFFGQDYIKNEVQ